MELGTGVFLSSVVLAIVILYGLTKDRWSWRRILRRMTLAVLALIIVGGAFIAGVQYWDYLVPVKPTRQTDYAGLRLGMTQDDVMYVKGYPPVVLAAELSDPEWKGFFGVVETKNLEKGKRVQDYLDWSYELAYSNINIAFNEARSVVAIQCYS